MRQNLTQCWSLMITLGEQFYAQRIMRIHSSRVFQGRRRTDTWVHQNGKVLGLATLSTLRGSREKRSSNAVDVPWERRFAFRAEKREGTAEKDGRRKRRRRRRGRVTVVSYFREILNCELRERRERVRKGERGRERNRVWRISPRYALYNGRSFFTLNLIKLRRSATVPAGYRPL